MLTPEQLEIFDGFDEDILKDLGIDELIKDYYHHLDCLNKASDELNSKLPVATLLDKQAKRHAEQMEAVKLEFKVQLDEFKSLLELASESISDSDTSKIIKDKLQEFEPEEEEEGEEQIPLLGEDDTATA